MAFDLMIRRARLRDGSLQDIGVRGEKIAAIAGPFVEYLKGEKGPAATALDGRTSVEMVLGAYRSAREGRRVMFPLEA